MPDTPGARVLPLAVPCARTPTHSGSMATARSRTGKRLTCAPLLTDALLRAYGRARRRHSDYRPRCHQLYGTADALLRLGGTDDWSSTADRAAADHCGCRGGILRRLPVRGPRHHRLTRCYRHVR